jgi:formylglycine-generating enzyme required for sulfatase activity
VPGGSYEMGSEEFEDSKPLHVVTVSPFWMDEHEVTNAQFASFVKATGYITCCRKAFGS